MGRVLFLLSFFCLGFSLNFQEAEKYDAFYKMINCALKKQETALKTSYEKGQSLYASKAHLKEYERLLRQIKMHKKKIEVLQVIAKEFGYTNKDEEYAFWDLQEITLSQFIIEFGQDAIYLIPQDLGAIKIHLSAQLAVPKTMWPYLIETILKENGVGIRTLNPFVKQLVRERLSFANVSLLTSNIEDLKNQDTQRRVALVLPLKNLDSKKQRFIESLAINDNVNLQIFEKEVVILGDSEKVLEYAKLIEFLSQEATKMHIETIVTKKLTAKEAKEFLELMSSTPKSSTYLGAASGQQLRILASFQFKHLLVLCGNQDEIANAKRILEEMEEKIEDPVEKTIFWYTCKHTQPDELAEVLQKVYPQLQDVAIQAEKLPDPKEVKVQRGQKANMSDAFIIDSKTSSMIMIVEKKSLEALKCLITKLDVPKKMVKIEVLLFEKKTKQRNQIGLASLETGSAVKNLQNGSTFKDGILNFFLSSVQQGNIPAFNFNYQFLLSNQDIQVNSAPSVTTMNATPAVISLTEEISINMGEIREKKGPAQKTYQREKFGITLKITPNVNVSEEDQTGYITLETDINFDTINSNTDDRPDVSKKHIENQVRIQDGQTLIIGGLRQKDFDKNSGKIPFLGDIPGIGKLFGNTKTSNNETEMFVFITPRILYDPINDLKRIQREELEKRPGDIPEFIKQLQNARKDLKQKRFEQSMQLLLQ